MRALAALFLVACTSQANGVGPSCPGQETAPPALPPNAMAQTACTIGAYERTAPADATAIPFTEDASLARQATVNSSDEMALIQAALDADQIGNLPSCIQYEKKALVISEDARSRLHLASCERRTGKMVDALKDSQKALEIGVERRDQAVMMLAHKRVKELLDLIPHVRFVEPPGTEIRSFTVDDKEVRHEHIAKTFSIDPGRHVLALEGTESGRLFQRTCTFDLAESTVVPVMLGAR